MAGDDITNAELARRLDSMHRDVHEDLTDIRRRMDSYVLREVYLADQRGQETRMTAIENAQADLRQSVKQADEKRSADRKWLISAIALPMLTLIVQIVLAVRGPV